MIEQAAVPVVVLDVHTVSIDPGSEKTVELRVRNHGAIVDAFHIEVLGPAAAWTTVEPATLSLFPDTGGRAVARFRPPRSWTMSAGILTVGFRVVSSVDPGRSSVEECELEIQAFSDVTAELRPRTSRGRMRGRHQLLIQNASNEPVEIALAARDVDGDCAVDVRPELMTVGPGRGRRARVRVKPSYRPLIGPAMESYAFETTVQPAGGQLTRLQGTMRQTAILPRGTLILALLAAVVLIGFVLYNRMGPILINRTNAVTSAPPTPIVAPPVPSGSATPAATPGPSASPTAAAAPAQTP
ncbi:MAG TPA: hypothetical protein VOB72_04690, partial [Candidatus Dormibacteraeota bacterium]|nr:hypothetical protein [Candidatus Dormibacteraeota bacterium]